MLCTYRTVVQCVPFLLIPNTKLNYITGMALLLDFGNPERMAAGRRDRCNRVH